MVLPGPVDTATGTVGSARILPGWIGLKPARELERRLGVPVDVDNDANLGALGEVSQGAGRGARDVVYLKLASGIGSGIVIGGRIHRGATGLAGEIGHFLADPEGSICRCGNRGCLETVAAAPALLELLRRSHGEDLDIPGLLALAADGDVGCRRALGDAGRALGRALAAVINCLNPEMLIIGGELSAAGEPLLEGIRESVRRFALPAAADAVTVTAGVLGNRAEVLGALALVIGDTERLSSVRLSAA
jgi:predicted NBD/HSP70 family sugar kinase